jgi:hypothetical protein
LECPLGLGEELFDVRDVMKHICHDESLERLVIEREMSGIDDPFDTGNRKDIAGHESRDVAPHETTASPQLQYWTIEIGQTFNNQAVPFFVDSLQEGFAEDHLSSQGGGLRCIKVEALGCRVG